MKPEPYEALLRHVASCGELTAQDFVKKVTRVKNDYTDFYGVAALMHNGYIATDTTVSEGPEKQTGVLGLDTRKSAEMLCQLALPMGASFMVDGCLRDSCADFPVRIFITGKGILKIEELDERAAARKQKRIDYAFAIFVAILAALVSSIATRYLAAPQSATFLPAPAGTLQKAAP